MKKIVFLIAICLLFAGCGYNEKTIGKEESMRSQFDEKTAKKVLMNTLEANEVTHLNERIDAIIDVLQKAGVKGVVSAESVEQERFPVSIQIVSEEGKKYEVGMKKNLSVEAIKDLETSEYIYMVIR